MTHARWLLVFVLILATTALAGESSDRDPREHFFTLSFGDLPDELRLARNEGKLGMLLFFEADECPYCQQMLKSVFSKRSVQDWFGHRYLSIAVDIHGDVELQDFDGATLTSKAFANDRGIFMTPVISFIDLDGVEIYRHLGMVETAEELLLLGEFVADRHFLDTEYATYLEANGISNDNETLMTPAAEDDST